jgi:hypothetical protein
VLHATIPLRLADELALAPGRRTTVVLHEKDIYVLPIGLPGGERSPNFTLMVA